MRKSVSEIVKEIFNCMLDDESRMIFQYMTAYFFDNRINHIWDMLKAVNEYDKLKPWPADRLRNLFSVRERYNGQPVILYGAGGNAPGIKAFLETLGVKATAYCDSDPRKWNVFMDGLPIVSPDMLLEQHIDSLVIVSSPIYEDEISRRLIQMGVTRDRIFLPTFSESQYFGIPFITPIEDEIYLDAGPYDGKTIIQFLKFCNNKYKKIYAMEPDPENYQKTCRYIEKLELPNISLIEKGVWNCDAVLNFEGYITSGSRITTDGSVRIPVTTIDKVVGDDNVTLVKMDIEGAELNALKGSEGTIKRCKPRLAICIYHRPEDIFEIPICLLELNPEYKFYIRQHAISCNETVIYAV